MSLRDQGLVAEFVRLFDPPADRREALDPRALDALYQDLPARLPRLYEILVSQWRWDEVEVSGITLLANPDPISLVGLLESMNYDDVIFANLKAEGYIPFARSSGGSWDPICFAKSPRQGARDRQVVQINHEDILCKDRISRVTVLSATFRWMLLGLISTDSPAKVLTTGRIPPRSHG